MTVYTVLTIKSTLFIAKDCGPLPDIQDGNVDITSTLYPGKARYSCNPGFQIAEGEEAAVRSCGTNGIWEGIEPHCERNTVN